MIKLLKHNIPFLSVFLLFVVSTATIITINGKLEAQQLANSYHNNFGDYLFYYATHIVEAYFAPIILLAICFFYSFKHGFLTLIAFLLTGAITQFFKLFVFNDAIRPTGLIPDLRLIPESFHFTNTLQHSFPSGHTTAAFAVFCSLAIIISNKKWGYVFAIIAALIGYSRVYLSQHFFEDLLVGSIIGTLGTFTVFGFLNRFSFGKLSQYSLRGKVND